MKKAYYRRRSMAMAISDGEFSKNYITLNYIAADNNQYIDTGIKGDATTSLSCIFKTGVTIKHGMTVYGCFTGWQQHNPNTESLSLTLAGGAATNAGRLRMGSNEIGRVWINAYYKAEVTPTGYYVFYATDNDVSETITGNWESPTTFSEDWNGIEQTKETLLIGYNWCDHSDNENKYGASGKNWRYAKFQGLLGSFTIKKNNVIVRDFIPVARKTDLETGTPLEEANYIYGFYERIEGRFYRSISGTDFYSPNYNGWTPYEVSYNTAIDYNTYDPYVGLPGYPGNS